MVSVFENSLALKSGFPGTYPFHFLTYFRQHAMVFSSKDKAIIKNNREEKGWLTCRLFKKQKSKEWVLSPVQRLLKRSKEDGSMNRRTGSGRTITVKQFTVKQFSGRLKTVKEREGQCVKMICG